MTRYNFFKIVIGQPFFLVLVLMLLLLMLMLMLMLLLLLLLMLLLSSFQVVAGRLFPLTSVLLRLLTRSYTCTHMYSLDLFIPCLSLYLFTLSLHLYLSLSLKHPHSAFSLAFSGCLPVFSKSLSSKSLKSNLESISSFES